MKNHVIASFTFGYGREYEDYYDPAVLGISSKGLHSNRRRETPDSGCMKRPWG